MSGSFKRRHSKWDHKDSEDVTENFHEKAQTRRPREEPVSPSRGSQRRDSRSKEIMMAWDTEENNARMSTGPGDLRRHHSRSPRNGWGRLHSRSRSRSRSRSPSHYLRRETAVHGRSRSRSGVSAQLCKEFVAGRCRRGSSCHFLHQDAQPYDSHPDDWESRPRRVGGSRYSPIDAKDYPPRVEKAAHICTEFLKGRCRRGASCKYEHHDPVSDDYPHRNHDGEPVDVFEKGPADDVHRGRGRDVDNVHRSRDPYCHRNNDRETADVFEKGPIDVFHQDRDHSRRNRDTYSHRNHDREHADVFEKKPVDDVHRDRDRDRENPHRRRDDREPIHAFSEGPVDDHRVRDAYRNHDREPFKRGGPPLCKFFASGNCKNGNRCRFVHEVRERVSPEKRSRNDKWRSDNKVESSQGWDGSGWDEVDTMQNNVPSRGWGDEVDTMQNNVPSRGWGDEVDTMQNNVPSRGWGDEVDTMQNNVPSRGWGDEVDTMQNNVPLRDWGDEVDTMQNNVPLRDWGDEKNEAVEVRAAKSGDNSQSHETWAPPVAKGEVKMQVEQPPLQWKTENSVPSIGLSGDMEISPRDNIKQSELTSSNANMSFATDLPGTVGETFYEKPYSVEFQAQKPYDDPFPMHSPSDKDEKPYNNPFPMQKHPSHKEEKSFDDPFPMQNHRSDKDEKPFNDPFPMQNHPSHKEEKPYNDPFPMEIHPSHKENPNMYPGEGTNVIRENHHPSHEEKTNVYHQETTNAIGNNHGPSITPPQHGFFQSDHIVGVQPSSGVSSLSPHLPNPAMNISLQQGLLQTVAAPPSSGVTPLAPHFSSQIMVPPQQGFFTSDQTSFVNSVPIDGPHLVNATPSGIVSATAANHTTVSDAQLAQVTNLAVSLQQLLEHSKLPQLNVLAGMPPVNVSTMQTHQVPEIHQQQYDPTSGIVGTNVHDLRDPRLTEKRVLDDKDANMKQQVPVRESKDDEKVKEIAEGSMKDPENRPSEDVPIDDGDDANKSKDSKAIRPFKFALAELVKELLKPSWKDGHVSKDAYKTIVKKVVDKIIETQGLQIPQTKEKIDHYLSCSKPKIDKLVQAYVGKFQKT